MAAQTKEETGIVVVGGGPVGTLLGALLSRNYSIPCVVLEKETSIPTDPRAFSLTEDGIRCLQSIGLYDFVYTRMGGARRMVHFVTGRGHYDIQKRPMLSMNIAQAGVSGHTRNVMFNQPVMEGYLRGVIKEGGSGASGEFKDGAEVIGIEEDGDGVDVRYRDVRTDEMKTVRAKYVVGTDGRRGFVRKKYLEPKGILLQKNHDGELFYCGINWDILLPTPKTHPEFPLWAKGYKPEDVLEEYMPSNFVYMCNPDRNCVFSRAGVWTGNSRLWRTEFALKPGEDREEMAKYENVAKLVEPYMTHKGKRFGLKEDVTFPKDCIQPRRSWVYKFESRMCNKWWEGRVMLAGDAAHIFPPYGGQGVTQGFLDVSGLAWRLAQVLESTDKKPDNLLNGWEIERKSNVRQSLTYTYMMGDIFEETNPIKLIIREVMMWLLQLLPFTRRKVQNPRVQPAEYQYAPGAAFLPDLGGGKAFFQCYCKGLKSGSPVTFSDELVFSNKQSAFGMMVLVDSVAHAVAAEKELAASYDSNSLVKDATYIVDSLDAAHVVGSQGMKIVRIASWTEFGASPLCKGRYVPEEYDDHVLANQYRGKRFIIARADKVVFAACKDMDELSVALDGVERVRSFNVA